MVEAFSHGHIRMFSPAGSSAQPRGRSPERVKIFGTHRPWTHQPSSQLQFARADAMRLRLGRPGVYIDVGRPTPEHQADRGPPDVHTCQGTGFHVRNSGSVFGCCICLAVSVRVVSVASGLSRAHIRIVSPVDPSADPLSRTSEPPTHAIVAIYLASRGSGCLPLAEMPTPVVGRATPREQLLRASLAQPRVPTCQG